MLCVYVVCVCCVWVGGCVVCVVFVWVGVLCRGCMCVLCVNHSVSIYQVQLA